jgi:histidinol-phosphatase (PHP family)
MQDFLFSCNLFQRSVNGLLRQNYHTHTWRCRHAQGAEREYIEQAIAAGIRVLGFSDHAPYSFPDGHDSGFRMFPDQTAGYFETLLALREEYAGQIEIHIGFEAEYYPGCWEAFLQHIHKFPCEYLILGQHMLENEETQEYSSAPTGKEDILRRYVDQVIAGMETGAFSYLAHPDLLRWTGNAEVYQIQMRRLCEAARRLDLPLEINFLGLYEGRHYPNDAFWKIAGETGNRAILGCDAHEPAALNRPDIEKAAMELARRFAIPVSQELELRRP